MDLSIAIVSWNTRDVLDQCLRSVYETVKGIEFEVIVVDNASSDGSAEMIRDRYPRATLIANEGNAGFAAANNQAYRACAGRHFMLLNPDTICREGALAGLVRFLDENPAAGAVGPLVTNDDGTIQYSWARFPTIWSESIGYLNRRIGQSGFLPITDDETRDRGPFRVDWIGGCCLMIRREAVEKIGLMDESLFMYSEETDWCMRLCRAGWEVWVDPGCEIVHLGGKSSDQAKPETARYLRMSKRQYFRKHHGVWPAAAVGAVLAVKAGLRQLLRAGAWR